MPEKTASSAHTIFVRAPSGNRIEVTIPPGKQPGELFTVMLEDVHAYPPDWEWFAAPPAAPAHSAPPPWAGTHEVAIEGEEKPASGKIQRQRDRSGTQRPPQRAACPARMAGQRRAPRGRQSRREARQEVPPPPWLSESPGEVC